MTPVVTRTTIYGPEAFDTYDETPSNVVLLWDDSGRAVAGGTNYDDQDDLL
ncbi:hypothetical protein [Actinosynnema sp. NPDC020468]|uniref:hypothetical protein n=1 Tax=Actinosynnema sp. NPDC020468 TaxID=3154488 RepID=UPI0033EED55D